MRLLRVPALRFRPWCFPLLFFFLTQAQHLSAAASRNTSAQALPRSGVDEGGREGEEGEREGGRGREVMPEGENGRVRARAAGRLRHDYGVCAPTARRERWRQISRSCRSTSRRRLHQQLQPSVCVCSNPSPSPSPRLATVLMPPSHPSARPPYVDLFLSLSLDCAPDPDTPTTVTGSILSSVTQSAVRQEEGTSEL